MHVPFKGFHSLYQKCIVATWVIFLRLNLTWMQEFAGSGLVCLQVAQALSVGQILHTPAIMSYVSCLFFHYQDDQLYVS